MTSRRSDTEGYLSIRDRKKDMIISGGVNIYPAEIEAVLYAHPQILDAAVIGIPDDEWGRVVVRGRAGRSPARRSIVDELGAFVSEARRSATSARGRYELRAELPRTDSGKLLKRVLRDEFWSEQDRAV